MEYPVVNLSVCLEKLESGGRPKGGASLDSNGIISIGAEHLNDNGEFKLSNPKFIPSSYFDKMRQGIIEDEDILIVKDGATTGKTIFVSSTKPFVKAAVNEHVFPVRTNKCILLPKYAFYILYSSVGKQQILSDFRGAAQGGISRSFANQVLFTLPSLSEQRRIVEILDQADEIPKLRKQADEKAEKMIPALFYEMFGDPISYTGKLTIRNIVKKVEQKDFRRLHDYQFKYIDISSIDGSKGKIISFSNYLGSDAPSRAKQIVNYNDVLVSTVRPYLKATALVPENLDNQVCSTGFCVLRTKEAYGFGFLYALSRLDWFSNKLMSMARGASYPAVSDSDVLSLNIPYPSENESLVKKFDDIIINLELKRNLKEKSTERIKDLFDLLLSKAFDGSLTASWREAHMKELLKEMEEQKKYLEKVN